MGSPLTWFPFFLHSSPLISFFKFIEGDDYIQCCLDGYTRTAAHQGGIMRHAQRRFFFFVWETVARPTWIEVFFFGLSFVARRFSFSLVLSLFLFNGLRPFLSNSPFSFLAVLCHVDSICFPCFPFGPEYPVSKAMWVVRRNKFWVGMVFALSLFNLRALNSY